MPTVAWIYSSADPAASGELRRLVLPALGIEGGAWTSRVVSAAHLSSVEADVAVAPLAAVHVLPSLSHARVIIEVDDAAVQDPLAIGVLGPLAGRIDAVVARGVRALHEAVRILPDQFPVLLIPDASETLPELQASAIRFGLRPPAGGDGRSVAPEGCELWFAGPGDVVDAAEMAELARRWRRTASAPRAVVADPPVLELIAQSGLEPDYAASGASVLNHALGRAGCCVVPAGAESSRARRRRAAQRHGVALVDSLAGPGGESCDSRECAAAWRSVISGLLDSRGRGRGRAPTVLVVLDLVQDLDLALPIVDELASRSDVQLKLVVTTWLDDRSPRVAAELAIRRVQMQLATRQQVLNGVAPSLDGVDAVLCVVETSDPAHARCHALVRRAKAAGIPTFSLQHGLENVGLTLFPGGGGGDRAILSDHVFVWFGREQTPEVTPASLRPRLIHVGRPAQAAKGAGLRAIFEGYSRLATVFENLHWDRYSQAYRRRFLEDVCEFAQAYPETAVLVKPHHAGMWTAKNRSAFPQWGANLVLADPSDPMWEPFTAPSLVAAADLVITTPSTVALDAALARRPVAVVAYGMDLPVFAPLPLLQGPADWISFGRSTDPAEGAGARAAFVSRVNLPGPAERAAADCVAAAAAVHAGRTPVRTAAE